MDKMSLYGEAVGFIEDNKSRVHRFSEAVAGYVITNDGSSDLTVSILGETFRVRPGEQFDEEFGPFSAAEIDVGGAVVSYRAYGRR